MEFTATILHLIPALLTALIAGLFYAYACSVNPGLGLLLDAEYIKSMQNINKAILNPWFFISFIGTVILLPLCTWVQYKSGFPISCYYLAAATLVYITGVFGVTVLGNVPLNKMLDKFDVATSTLLEIKSQRTRFEVPWNRLNLIRTLACILSLLLILISIWKNNQ